jgi:hypothetical protein
MTSASAQGITLQTRAELPFHDSLGDRLAILEIEDEEQRSAWATPPSRPGSTSSNPITSCCEAPDNAGNSTSQQADHLLISNATESGSTRSDSSMGTVLGGWRLAEHDRSNRNLARPALLRRPSGASPRSRRSWACPNRPHSTHWPASPRLDCSSKLPTTDIVSDGNSS